MRSHDFRFILKRRLQVFLLAKSSKRHSFHHFFVFYNRVSRGPGWPWVQCIVRLALNFTFLLPPPVGVITGVLRKASLTQKFWKKHRSHGGELEQSQSMILSLSEPHVHLHATLPRVGAVPGTLEAPGGVGSGGRWRRVIRVLTMASSSLFLRSKSCAGGEETKKRMDEEYQVP